MKLPSASEIKRKGDAYFRSRRTVRTDKNGLPVRDDEGNILFGSDAPYTVTGYAEAIGLGTVEELFVFPDEERQLLVKKALLRIEAYAEEHLFNKDSFPGAKLFLSVNFKRWSDKVAEDEGIDEEAKSALDKWGK
ncbi:MAG: hypothetical protein E7665_05515 [Ruminococcaceae bacterium]|nr:hypothetical protein [Oscillospiraceae bacterium]